MESCECSNCGETKLRDKFYPEDKTKAINKNHRCIACEAERKKQKRHLDQYKVTVEEFEEQMRKQNHKCPVCLHKIVKNRMKLDRNKDEDLQGILCSDMCLEFVSNGSKICGRALKYITEAVKPSPSDSAVIIQLLSQLALQNEEDV